MSPRARRRRAVMFAGLALASGSLAAGQVRGRVGEVEARVGPLVPVVVTRAAVESGTRIGPRRAERLLAVRRVPARFAPRDALAAVEEAIGLETSVAMPEGSYVTASALGTGEDEETSGPPLRRGERALELRVAGGEGIRPFAGPGARVDVLVSSEAGGGRSYLALEDVELLDLRAGDPAAGSDEAGAPASSVATLRVTLRQAVFLTAAENFGREIRLLARPPGDRRRSGGAAVPARSL